MKYSMKGKEVKGSKAFAGFLLRVVDSSYFVISDSLGYSRTDEELLHFYHCHGESTK